MFIVSPESSPPNVCSGEPLLFIYGCENTVGSHIVEQTIEIAAMVLAPEGVLVCVIHPDLFLLKVCGSFLNMYILDNNKALWH